MTNKIETLAEQLFETGGIKFGEFKLKSGIMSPVYVDLRGLVSYPEILRSAAKAFADILKGLEFDLLGGIPYAGLPIAVAVSLEMNRPMVYARKEIKQYGTMRQIEGKYTAGQKVILIDDVISNAESKFEGAEPFQENNLVVKDFIILLDRGQGGREILESRGYKLHSVTTLSEVLRILVDKGRVEKSMYDKVLTYLKENRFF